MFLPPPQKQAAQGGDNGAAAVDDLQDADGAGGDADPANAKPNDDDPAQANDPDPSDDTPEVKRVTDPKWMTLGSMAPDSPYWMLVTLNSRGGGIERIELTKRREDGRFQYSRVDTRSGYLGYFAGQSAATIDGVLVNVVGHGTPASLASADGQIGIQPGDVIVAVAGSAVALPADIDIALAKTTAGDEVTVEVMRSGKSMLFTAKLSEHPLDLVRLSRYGGADQIDGNLDRLSCLLTLGKVNGKTITVNQKSISGMLDPTTLVWDATETEMEAGNAKMQIAEFALTLSDTEMESVGAESVRMRRSYSLGPGSYELNMDVEITNLGSKPQDLAYRVEGPNGLTMEGWWYSYKNSPNFGGTAARDIVYKTDAEGHELLSGYGLWKQGNSDKAKADQNFFAETDSEASRTMEYIGVDAQYFTVAYLPTGENKSIKFFRSATGTLLSDLEKVERHTERGVNTSFFLDSVVRTIPPKKALSHQFRLFAGPKEPELMQTKNLDDTIYYGWPIFAFFAKILGGLLHILYSIVGNYAVAIIMLTVIVRGAMFPLSRKAAVNAQRMQELAPEMKKIAEKYKDDMEGRLKAQRELQQRVGFNPLAGCLPMFMQLPIFMGLYRALSVDISLRGEPLHTATNWASNLSGPDQFTYWGDWLWEYLSGRGTGWMGPYFNILPVIVIALFIFQQKMFMPPATDEQTAMTQKIMLFMTIMMGLFFFRFPAGLCLYFIASSIWGMCERVLVKRTLPKSNPTDPGVVEGKLVDSSPKKESWTDKVRNQIKPPEEPVLAPNKRKRPPGGKNKR